MNRINGLVPDVDWKKPDDVIVREVDPMSGLLATPFCPSTRREYFVTGTQPSSVCPLHSGGGEPTPFFRDEMQPPPDVRAEGPPMSEEPQTAEQQQQQKKKKETGIRRLLRAIFGSGQ